MPLRECFFGDQQRTGAPLQLSMQLLDSVAADHGHVLVLESGTREREILRRRRQHQHAHIVAHRYGWRRVPQDLRSEEHTSELQSIMRISYAVLCLKKKQ